MSSITITLSPRNIIGTYDTSATLTVNLLPASGTEPIITIDPSYIAFLDGSMTSVDDGLTWTGNINSTPGMNLLGNTLTVTSDVISSNIVFDVVQNLEIVNKKWTLSNNSTINKTFTKTLQMSPNGLLMGFINGSNVEIYRKSESSNWVSDVSYIGHKFALTNNHIAIASDELLQIYDYSGNSWNIMIGGNIAYLNIIALSINLDGTYVAISNNTDVKVLQYISNSWTHINTHNNAFVNGLSLSPNGLKLGMGIGTIGQDFSSILVEDIVNNKPPEIALIGESTINHEVNTTYIDQGATAFDTIDGYITNNIIINNNVDNTTLGSYIITYDVLNSNNILAIQKIRKVNVVDTTPPNISLNGDAIIDIYIGDEYIEQGVTATDNSQESLTIETSGVVNTNVAGSYIITYTAKDSTGNSASVSRTVNVNPSIVYSGNDNIFDLMNFGIKLLNSSITTNADFTISDSSSTYLNGEYSYKSSTNYSYYYGKNIFSERQYNWISARTKGPGNVLGYISQYKPLTVVHDNVTGNYLSTQFQNEIWPHNYVTIYFTHYCNSNSVTYAGEFVEWKFPFLLEPNKLTISVFDDPPNELVLLGSDDDGLTWNLITTISINVINTINETLISTTSKYSRFKLISTICKRFSASSFNQIKIFGKIYK